MGVYYSIRPSTAGECYPVSSGFFSGFPITNSIFPNECILSTNCKEN